MKNCNKCGAAIPDEAMFCTSCGAPADEIEGTTVLADDGINDINEADFEATGLLNEDDLNLADVYKEPINESNAYAVPTAAQPAENVNSAFMNPDFQQNQAPQFNSFQSQGNIPQNKITYIDFFERLASKKTKNLIKATGIIAIITAVLSLGFVVMGNYLSIIDIAVYTVLAVLILKKKSWVFTLVMSCYSGLFTVIGLVMTGTPGGIFALVIAIIATINGKKLSDAYNNYIAAGVFPANQI